jgi:hypothetical protein
MEEDEYELISLEEVGRLKREIERLKANPFIQNSSEERFYEAVSNLTESVNKLYTLFDNVNKQLMKEYQTGNSPEEKLDRILDQNQSIAEALVAFGSKEEAQAPQQYDTQLQYDNKEQYGYSQQYSQDEYSMPDASASMPQNNQPQFQPEPQKFQMNPQPQIKAPVVQSPPQVSMQQIQNSQPQTQATVQPSQPVQPQIKTPAPSSPKSSKASSVQSQPQPMKIPTPQSPPVQMQVPIQPPLKPKPQSTSPVSQSPIPQSPISTPAPKNRLQPVQSMPAPNLNVPPKEVPFQSSFQGFRNPAPQPSPVAQNQNIQGQTYQSIFNQAPSSFAPPVQQFNPPQPVQQAINQNPNQNLNPNLNQDMMFDDNMELNYPVPERLFQPMNEAPSIGEPIDVKPTQKKKGLFGFGKK